MPQKYHWDIWEEEALAKGVTRDLAALGRAVMREHYQHDWNDFGSEVGSKAGHSMIELALSHSDKAEQRWGHLLDTDGEKVRILDDGTILDYHTGQKI